MERIELNIGGKDLVFAVEFEDDYDAGTPWEMADGHGPVTGWERRNKRPGELVLNSDRGLKDTGRRLTEAAHNAGDCWPYIGDDDLIYIS
ncbi:hypothetical protein ACM744_06785 [Pseudomonas aeruginosa]